MAKVTAVWKPQLLEVEVMRTGYKKSWFLGLLSLVLLVHLGLPASLSGQDIARSPDYTLMLKSRTFYPDTGIHSVLWDAMDQRQHVIVQFWNVPTDLQKATLLEQGVEILDYLPKSAFYASVSGEGLDFLDQDGNVRAVLPIEADDRIAPVLREEGVGHWARNDDGTANLIVMYFKDVPREDVRDVISRYGTIVDEPPLSNIWTIRIDESRIWEFAEEDIFFWIQNDHLPLETNLDQALPVIGADVVQAAPYNLDGTGVTVAEWDGGWIDINHDDFAGRVTRGDAGSYSADHATHVGGCMAGDGDLSGGVYRGVATNATIRTYEWPDDITELDNETTDAITNGAVLSQNSWSYSVGASAYYPCSYHGDYDAWSVRYDEIVNGDLGTEIVVCCSSGNEENDGDCPPYPWNQVNPPMGTAKNPICVGAIYSDTYAHTCFSSRGPVDDGRLKPDLVAPGDEANDDPTACLEGDMIRSTCVGDTYCEKAGTSMSTPMVSGAVALMREQFTNEGWTRVPPHTYKAILTQAANDRGNPGPDYTNGHGSLDIPEAIDLIRYNGSSGNLIRLANIYDGETDVYYLSVPPGLSTLRVTLAWDDPPGTPAAATELVNDLDLYLVAPGGSGHYAYVLDPDNPGNVATTGWNGRDNLEVVQVAAPEAGQWEVRVWGWDIPVGAEEYTLVTPAIPVECGDELYADTFLFNDLNCTGDGLIIAADNICLDCQGHTISGDLGYSDYGVTINGRTGITIQNCVIENFGCGVYMDNADNCTIGLSGGTNIIWENTNGIQMVNGSDGNTVSYNWMTNNAERGIEIQDSQNNDIGPSNAMGNNKRSVVLDVGAANNTVLSNALASNEFYGVLVAGDATTLGNEVYDNSIYNNNYGVRFYNVGLGNNINSNEIYDNDYGIQLNHTPAGHLAANNVYSNNLYGIQLMSTTSGVTLNNNTFCDNPTDIYDGSSNTGNENKCTNTTGWADDGQPSGCDWDCSGCRYPEDDLLFSESITLCPGTYNIPDAGNYGVLIFDGDDIVLDCNGAELIGDGTREAIRNYGHDYNTVTNCRCSNYERGIQFTQSANNNVVLNNNMQDNTHGMRSYNSSNNTYQGNTAEGNDIGILLTGSSSGHELYDNFLCENEIDIQNDGTASGNENRCDTAVGYADNGQVSGCDSLCTETRIDSDLPEVAPATFFLGPATPNPFNPITEITFGIPAGAQPSRVTMNVYDSVGRRVRTLVDSDHGPGTYRVIWDGNDHNGVPTASGVYFYRIVWGDRSETNRMVLLK
jgi:parallel beta-helix repeat protein